MTKHIAFADAIADIASNRWGRNAESAEGLMASLTTNSISDAAGLYLVRILEVFFDSIANVRKMRDLSEMMGTAPEDAVRYPDVKIGDFLYSADPEEGLTKYIVAGITEGGFCQIVRSYLHNPDDPCSKWVHYATTECRTAADAWKKAAASDIKYHKPRVEAAERILAMVASGEDLSSLDNGVEIDDEQED